MGKTTASCFKIMACGGDRADRDDMELPEEKPSVDKHRWSFQRRSSRNQTQTNTVISEPLSVAVSNKESPEASTNFQPPTYTYIQEKIPQEKCLEERPPSSTITDSKVSDTLPFGNVPNQLDSSIPASVVIVIQSAVRGYLARKELHKLKNVVKLQAAARGRLVRRQAVGTLRCVQAIVKMQALVRARLGQDCPEKVSNQEAFGAMIQTDAEISNNLTKENSGAKQETFSSTEKLLKNGFARQLLESTPKTKPIYISCDPLRTDSAWKWLERWMAVTSPHVGQQEELALDADCQGVVENSTPTEPEMPVKLSISRDADIVVPSPTSAPDKIFGSTMKNDQEQLVHTGSSIVESGTHSSNGITKETCDSDSSQLVLQPDATLQYDPLREKQVVDKEESKCTTEIMPCEPLESEDKKSVFGSRKSLNPTFAAVKSKFEELSAVPTSGWSTRSFQEGKEKAKSDSLPSQGGSLRKFGSNITENSISHEQRVQTAISESGTGIFVSSILNSPDRSETECGEIVIEIKASEKRDKNSNGDADNTCDGGNAENKKSCFDLKALEGHKPGEFEENSSSAALAEQPSSGLSESDMQTQLENAIDQQAYRSSPQATPTSHLTAMDSQGTPESLIAVNPKESKTDDNLPSRKQRSQTTSKKSPSNTNHDSSARSSTENLLEDLKNGRRGSNDKLEDVCNEPKSGGSNSLPSYMQATESARAKFQASNSTKLSLDVLDKDSRKRHSLPIGNAKQDSSPRMQRSASLLQQSSKGGRTHSPQNSAEKKWQL